MQKRNKYTSIQRKAIIVVLTLLPHLTGQGQHVKLDLDLKEIQNPEPTHIQYVLKGNDVHFSDSVNVQSDRIRTIINRVPKGNYTLRVHLFHNREKIVQGYGRGMIQHDDTTLVHGYTKTVNDTLYLLLDWGSKTGAKGEGAYYTVGMLDTTDLKVYRIHNPDSLADEWQERGMPKYVYKDVKYSYLDSNLVPVISYSFGDHRSPVATGLMLYAFYEDLLRTNDRKYEKGFLNNANWLVAHHDTNYYYHYGFNYNHGGRSLPEGWVSGMAQGNTLGGLSLAFNYTGDSVYLKTAAGIFKTMYSNTENEWCVHIDENDYYWVEEYPNRDICHVLNGKITGLFGIWQYYVVTRDPFALKLFSAGLRSLADHWQIWNITGKNKSYYCEHHASYPWYHLKHLYQFYFLGHYFDVPELLEAVEEVSNREFCVYPADRLISPEEGESRFQVFNATNWNTSHTEDWISLEQTEQNAIILQYTRNDFDSDRKGGFDVKDEDSDGVKTVLLTQQKDIDYFYTDPDSLVLPAHAGQRKVRVYSSRNWTVSYDTTWFVTDRTGDTLLIQYDENKNPVPRTGEFYLMTEEDARSYKFLLVQEAATSNYSFRGSQDQRILFYPNPAREHIYLHSKEPLTGTIHILDMTGRVMTTRSIVERSTVELDVSSLAGGSYILKTKFRGESRCQIIIVVDD